MLLPCSHDVARLVYFGTFLNGMTLYGSRVDRSAGALLCVWPSQEQADSVAVKMVLSKADATKYELKQNVLEDKNMS